jgi:hypothetical protein
MVLTLREPARLIHSDSTDGFTQRLLHAAELDQPNAHALSQTATRVAALMARDAHLVVATQVREVASTSRIRTGRPDARRITRAAGIGLLLGTSLAAAVVGVSHTRPPEGPTTATSIQVRPVPSIRRASRVAVRRRDDAPVAAAPASASANQPHDTRVTRVSNDALGQELELLDSARMALSVGNPQGAMNTLNEAARLPHRVLIPEATVLRVRALIALNRTTEARRLVGSFVAKSPNSPVNLVLRDLVAPFEKQ